MDAETRKILLDELARRESKPKEVEAEIDAEAKQILSDELARREGTPTEQQGLIPDETQAFIESGIDAATLGYYPQIRAGLTKAAGELTGQDVDYITERDKIIARQKEVAAQNPRAALAGTVGGSLASFALPGGAAAKGAGSLAKLGRAAGTGAAMGLLQNPENVEGETGLQLEERLSNAKTGAALGAGVGAVGLGVGKSLNAVSPKDMTRFARNKALKAAGAMLKDFRGKFGAKRTERLGETLLEEGIVSAGDDIYAINKKVASTLDKYGKDLDNIYSGAQKISEEIPFSNLSKDQLSELGASSIDIADIVKDFSERLSSKSKVASGKFVSGRNKQVANTIADISENLAENGNNVSLEIARKVKQDLDDMINWPKHRSSELVEAQKEILNLRRIVNGAIEKRLQTIDKLTGQDNFKTFKTLNRKVGDLSEAFGISADKVARTEANRMYGLSEQISTAGGASVGSKVGGYIGGATGAAAGGVIGGVSGGLISRAAKKYGDTTLAVTANKAAKLLESSPKSLGKYAGQLTSALQKSPEEFVKVVAKIKASNPDFTEKKEVKSLRDLTR